MTEKDKKTVKDDKINPNQGPDGKFLPGNCANPKGKPKGTLNKATKDKREWVTQLLEDNEALIESALHNLASSPDPKDNDKALKHLLGLLEYTTPKLARSEITGADNGPVELFMVKRLEDPEASDDAEE